MTAATSQKLADVLRAAGFHGLAEKAEADAFHEYRAAHALPLLALAETLYSIYLAPGQSDKARIAAMNIRQRVIDGEFDASDKEADEWAASPEGQAAFAELTGRKDDDG